MLWLGAVALAAWLWLALAPGQFWRLLFDEPSPEPLVWPSVDVVVSARNEAEMLPRTLPQLMAQDYPGEWRVIVVDDRSEDGTGEIARALGATVISPDPPPTGWAGKVWAMNAGARAGSGEFVLFTDADIEHPAESLRKLAARALERDLDLTSRMVRLRCESAAEKLLVPAFVFFFAMLYPFRRVNRKPAAAGGTMLLRRRMLDKIGGMECIRGAIIDDCSLARAVHGAGGRIELTLVQDVLSLRAYPGFADVHQMVARSAYTQLGYSVWLLAGTCVGMALLFFAPFVGWPLGMGAWMVMTAIYWPMTRFYGRPWWFALNLPVAAVFYVAATIDSARLHWLGRGAAWKGRVRG